MSLTILIALILATALPGLASGKSIEKPGYELVCPQDENAIDKIDKEIMGSEHYNRDVFITKCVFSSGFSIFPECFIKGQEKIDETKLIEGDMVPDEIQQKGNDRNALIDPKRKWPNGKIHYAFHHGFTADEKSFIEEQMRFLENKTCIKFVPSKPEKKANTIVYITNGDGCVSTVGYAKKQRRFLNLNQAHCLSKAGRVQHEMLHVIGLLHEQSRPDRDEYVTILEENIEPGKENNFAKADPSEYTTFGVPYNYLSVMHYPALAFSKDKKSPTILPKLPVDPLLLGQRIQATEDDLKKVNLMYKCSSNE